jgi:hypothetical protein
MFDVFVLWLWGLDALYVEVASTSGDPRPERWQLQCTPKC